QWFSVGKRKITPEIEAFIRSNCTLTSTALSAILLDKFGLVISYRAIDPYLDKYRSEATSKNAAKIEAVRSKILDDADKWANKYLRYLDEETESLRTLIAESNEGPGKVKLETAKDRLAASQALHRMLSTIIDFVKPEEKTNVSISNEFDLSKLSVEELEQLRAIQQRLEGNQPGAGKQEPT
ncbi:MAG TPA: hypothetical protein VN455_09970, partial [Methanotrichaceae archaeon]|nr:hypothetical protein [Methanotrichaceae archaeon]